MKKNTSRATVVIGATMALVMAGTAAVSAAPGQRDDRVPNRGKAGFGAKMGGQMMPGMPGARGGMRGLGAGLDDFERREMSIQTADGITIQRVEQGAVDSAAADTLTFSLGSGEAVTVVIDDDTTFIGYEEQEVTRRGWSRSVMAASEIEADEVVTGTEVLVWSDSEDGLDFVASRVVVQPADEEADADATEADDSEADETASAGTIVETEGDTVTDA